MFLKILQNSQENTFARVSFFNKVAGVAFLQNTSGRLLLKLLEYTVGYYYYMVFFIIFGFEYFIIESYIL